MDSSSDPLLMFWRSFGDWGFILVLVGVVGEVVSESWLQKREEKGESSRIGLLNCFAIECLGGVKTARRTYVPQQQRSAKYKCVNSWLKKTARIFGAILIIGLLVEYEGHRNETSILDADNARLHLNAMRAEKDAEAIRLKAFELEGEIREAERRTPEKMRVSSVRMYAVIRIGRGTNAPNKIVGTNNIDAKAHVNFL